MRGTVAKRLRRLVAEMHDPRDRKRYERDRKTGAVRVRGARELYRNLKKEQRP